MPRPCHVIDHRLWARDPASGEVIAIINSVFVKGTKESALTSPSGITYAIPAQNLKKLLEHPR